MTSLSQIPGTFERSVLNSPRMLDGASGFGSQISRWLGPPWRKIRTTDLALPQPALDLVASDAFSAASACSFKTSPSPTPNKPAPPTRMNSRRLQPSHVLPGFPGIDNIDTSVSCAAPGCRHLIQYFELRGQNGLTRGRNDSVSSANPISPLSRLMSIGRSVREFWSINSP